MRLFNKTIIALLTVSCCVATTGLAMRNLNGLAVPDDTTDAAPDTVATGPAATDSVYVEPVHELPDSVQVTYKMVFGKDTVKTFTLWAHNHTAPVVPDSLSLGKYATFSYDTDSIISAGPVTVVTTINWSDDAPMHFTMPGQKPAYQSLHIQSAQDVYLNYSAKTEPNITCDSEAKDDNGMWAFYGDPYHMVVKNKVAGDSLQLASPLTPKNAANTGGQIYAVMTKDFKTNPHHVWRLYPAEKDISGTTVAGNGFYLQNAQGERLNIRSVNNSPNHLAYWIGGYDKGSAFIPVRPSTHVKYSIEMDGVVIDTLTTTSPIDAAAALPSNRQLGSMATFTYSPDTIREDTKSVKVTLDWNPYAPLQFSKTGDMHYYDLYISTKNGNIYINYNKDAEPNISMDKVAKGDSCQWAFVGNPYALKLVNKAAGDTLWLSSPSSTTTKGNNNGGDIHAVLSNDTVKNPDYLWHLYSATRDINGHNVSGGGVYIENKHGHKLNFRSPYLAYWNSGYDQGSAILIRQTTAKKDVMQPTLADGVYRISTTDGSKTEWAALKDGSLKVEATKPGKDENWHGLFLVRHTGKADSKTYSIQSLETGNYIVKQGTSTATITTGGSAYDLTLKRNSDIDSTAHGLWWNVYNDASATADGTAVWHTDASGNVVVWRVPTGTKPGTSDWQFERDSTITVDEISKRLTYFTGITSPLNGKVYRVASAYYNGRVLYDNYLNTGMQVATMNEDANNLYQLWVVDSVAPNRIKLKSLVSDKYVQRAGRSSFYRMVSKANASEFILEKRQADAYTVLYYLRDASNNNEGLHCASSQSYGAVSWNWDADANRWYFKNAAYNDSVLKKEQANYLARTDIRDNANRYNDDLAKYFKDNACTVLRSAYKDMADAALTDSMTKDGLPKVLQDMVLKIKDSTWTKYDSGNNWEKMFRLHKYHPQTDCDNYRWSGQMGIGYLWGNQTGPSGIAVDGGEDILYAFVDTVPANSYIAVELIPMGSQSGQMTKLHKGMNAILTNGSTVNVNVRYWCRTDNNEKYDGQGQTLKDFPDVMVHLEGGRVNGCFDLTRGMNDSTWTAMRKDGLVWAPGFNMRGKYAALHVRSQDIKDGKPIDGSRGSITTLMKTYDDVVRIENELEGFTTDSIGSKCFNGILEMNSVNSGYFASTYGCYIDHGSVRGLLHDNYAKPGEGLWGPAHEWGHNHQQHILMCGSTEQSNNLFSNVVIYKLTNQTSRGANSISTKQVADYYNQGKKWYQYGTWPYTQMLWKLYLYYHVAENDTTFFQKVFRIMRDNPLDGRWGSTTGEREYLKFPVACSQAAGENLEDFFRVWGFFRYPIDETIGDYRNTYMRTTKEMVDNALAKMRKYPKKGGNNLIFIDDHIRRLPNKVKGNYAYGELRVHNSDDPDMFGKMGDYGSWDAFVPDSMGWTRASLAEARKNDNGSVTYTTKPAEHIVGYKVYNGKGDLVWFANTKTFDVPADVVKKCGGMDSIYVKACATNGAEDYVGAVKVDIDESGYASLYYGDRSLKVPEGVEAQTYGMSTSGKFAKTGSYTTDNVIPQSTGVIIHAKAGTYRFEQAEEQSTLAEATDATPAANTNMLLGSDTTALTVAPDDAVGYKFYKLSLNSALETNSIGFYWGAENGGAFTNGAHKAYLALPGTLTAKASLLFSDVQDVVTGINSVNANGKDKSENTYNLSGQRVSDSYRGIVIKGGKKVLRK